MGKKKLKVVIDTSVFISSVLFTGKAERILNLWKKGSFVLLMSKDVLDEYIKVLHYPKFSLNKEEIKDILDNELLPFIHPVNTVSKLKIIKNDPDDNIFFDLAIDGDADMIVSGDTHMLSVKSYKKIKIVGVNRFMEILSD